jgi:hypothetical protein
MVTERPRMNRLRTVVSAALALFALSGIACKQGLNGRCELNSDCGDGLKCSTGDGQTKADSGKCVSSATPPPMDAAVFDTGGGNDDAMTTSDTAPDLSTADGSTGDAADDTSTPDALTGDDSAAPADASAD